MTVKCPKCHTENPDTARFCSQCATPLPSSEEISESQTRTIETAKEELTTGATFADRYQIIEELGKGGMGRVYKALDTKINEKIALKLIKPEIASDKKTLGRFSNELKLARKISHRNVGRMYELMEEGGTPFITMEYVAGEDLKRLIRKMNGLSAGQTIAIAKQVCEELSEAHRLGVVHRDLDDVFAIQDEVTLAIVDRMKVKLLGKEKQKLTKRSTDNPEAYQLYLKGRYFSNKRTPETYKKAVEFFNQAIEIDPEFALSYAGLASLYTTLGVFGLRRPKEVFPKAKSLVDKALEIDNNLASAHRVRASVSLFYDWNWSAAEKGYKKAIKIDPGGAYSYWIYAHYLSYMARFDEAIREMKKAVNLDPVSLLFNCDMGQIYYFARRYNESMRWYRKTFEIEPNYGLAFFHMGITYAAQENHEEAEKSFKTAIKLTGGLPWAVSWLSYIYAKLGKKEKAESLLQELHDRSKKEYIHPSCFTMPYFELEGFDKAFEYWNEAYEEREPTLCMLKVLPECDHLRSDSRFDELLKKMNLK